MKKYYLLCGIAIAFFSCNNSSSNANSQNDSATETVSSNAAPASNQLTTDEKADGWVALFDGKNLTGWRGYQNKSTDAWDVENGTLHCNGHKKDATPTDLVTDSEYTNFELSIQWKISPASNSGIMFHVNEKYPHTYLSGPEYQIIDDKGWPGELEPWQHTGCNYAMQLPDDSVPVNPVGEWNTTKIVVNNAHVEHWLNGKELLEYELGSPEWKKEKAAGKWKDDPEYGMSKTGHIALQYHGGDVWFRNIKLKQL